MLNTFVGGYKNTAIADKRGENPEILISKEKVNKEARQGQKGFLNPFFSWIRRVFFQEKVGEFRLNPGSQTKFTNLPDFAMRWLVHSQGSPKLVWRCTHASGTPWNLPEFAEKISHNNGRVFIQSWRWDPPKLSRKIHTQTLIFLGFRSLGIHSWLWFFLPGDENFQIFSLRCLSRKSGSQHQLRIKTLPSHNEMPPIYFIYCIGLQK